MFPKGFESGDSCQACLLWLSAADVRMTSITEGFASRGHYLSVSPDDV